MNAVSLSFRKTRISLVIIANAENVKSAEWQDEGNLDISEMITQVYTHLVVSTFSTDLD